MRRLVLVALVACGGGEQARHGAGDASVDGDAAPDTDASSCTTPDGDGDGVCDAQDVCPTVADPAQVDPDGDHIGWMCDSVESTVLSGLTGHLFTSAELVEPTFATSIATGCGGGGS